LTLTPPFYLALAAYVREQVHAYTATHPYVHVVGSIQWRLVVFVLEEASQNVRDIYLCAVKNLFKKLAQIQDV
jgi:hypothetical protein